MKEFEIKLAETSPLGKAGSVIKLALTPSDVHVPQELDTYLAGYSPFDYRADEASKVVPVDFDKFLYRNFGLNNAFKRVNVKASLQKSVPEVDAESAVLPGQVVDRLIGSFVPDVTELNTAGSLYRAKQVAAERCKTVIYLDRELDVWSMLSTATNWAPTNRITLG